jgi:hypothetical protein
MKYCLRSLMVVVTLACVALGAVGGRIEYLRRYERFHKERQGVYMDRVNDAWNRTDNRWRENAKLAMRHMDDQAWLKYHSGLLTKYHYAVRHPWIVVKEPPPPNEAP